MFGKSVFKEGIFVALSLFRFSLNTSVSVLLSTETDLLLMVFNESGTASTWWSPRFVGKVEEEMKPWIMLSEDSQQQSETNEFHRDP